MAWRCAEAARSYKSGGGGAAAAAAARRSGRQAHVAARRAGVSRGGATKDFKT